MTQQSCTGGKTPAGGLQACGDLVTHSPIATVALKRFCVAISGGAAEVQAFDCQVAHIGC